MKFRLTFKTPDVLDDTIKDYLEGFTHDERDHVEYEIRQSVEPYIEYGEYVTLVFDTENNSVSVVKK